jgi:predicted NBD/HSP70 family sugar kinase
MPGMSLGKATHQQTRALNQGLVLRTLYDRGPVSRAEVARLTGLTRTTVSDLVAKFMADGLAREVGRGASSGGKAPILLDVVGDSRLVLGLDLGEDAFVGALVNLRGEIRHIVEARDVGRDGAEALATVERLVEELLRAAQSPVLGIGIGTPGLVDTGRGTIRWAVNLDWQDLPLGAILREQTGLPTYVANDARAVALGEHLFASPVRQGSLVAIKVGLGIGAGIVLNGQLFQGDGFGAGEIGHISIVDDGAACRCGRFGCLETVASSRAIVKAATTAAVDHPDSMLGRRERAHKDVSLGDLADAVAAGDEVARQVVVAAGRPLGQAIAGIIGVLNVHRIRLLGSVTELGDPWLEAVRDEARRRTFGMLTEGTEIEIGHHHENVVVLGAVALLMTRELGLVTSR